MMSGKISLRAAPLVGAILFAMVVIAVGSWVVIALGVNNALKESAKITAAEWAEYLTEEVANLKEVVNGAPLNAEARLLFEKSQSVGSVFRYKLFDREGVLRLDSEKLDGGTLSAADLKTHNPTAANVVRTGVPYLKYEEGDGESRPLHYAEAYYPLTLDGELIGTIEVYVDQTARTSQLRSEWASTAAAIAAIAAAAFLVPAVAFFWRSRQHLEVQDALAYAANHDGLTGLLNRTSFRRLIDQRIGESPEDTEFCVLFIDLDKFKDVNDTRGHAVGDELLRQVAQRLSDSAGPDSPICRLGGDEFAVLPRAGLSRNDAVAMAERIIAANSETIEVKGDQLTIGASIGISEYPGNGRTSLDLLKAADLALYEAKRLGRGRYCIYEPAMEARRAQRIALETRLRRAVDQRDFGIAYQPLYRTSDQALTGFEALLRLTHDDGKAVPPSEFIPIAEETGLIVPLGEQVLHEVCKTAAGWRDDLSVAVNLSPVQFESGTLTRTVAEALAASGLPPRRLELEVTESILMTDPDVVALQLDELKELGVFLALDDFGTGYSSLSYLWKFPFDKLKIDRSFINSLSDEDKRSRQVLKTVVALGEVLSMSITAEGVETSDQADRIGRMKVDFVQGYFYGRPALIDDLSDVVAVELTSPSDQTAAKATRAG